MPIQPPRRSRTACWVRAATLFLAFVTAGTWVAGPGSAHAAGAGTVLEGPVPARVLRIVDGDTIRVRATVWLGQHIEVSVRLAGIDAPELRSRCTATRHRAWRARNRLHHLIAGTTVFLHDIRRGKYAGRVVANVRMFGGDGVGAMLLAAGLAEPSDGRRTVRRPNTAKDCPAAKSRTALVAGR